MLNFIYTALEPSKIEEFYEMKQLLDQLNKYCKGCGTELNIKSLSCNCR